MRSGGDQRRQDERLQLDERGDHHHPGGRVRSPPSLTPRGSDPRLSAGALRRIMQIEDAITENGDHAYELGNYWGSVRLCFDIEVLRDELEGAGAPSKCY